MLRLAQMVSASLVLSQFLKGTQNCYQFSGAATYLPPHVRESPYKGKPLLLLLHDAQVRLASVPQKWALPWLWIVTSIQNKQTRTSNDFTLPNSPVFDHSFVEIVTYYDLRDTLIMSLLVVGYFTHQDNPYCLNKYEQTRPTILNDRWHLKDCETSWGIYVGLRQCGFIFYHGKTQNRFVWEVRSW